MYIQFHLDQLLAERSMTQRELSRRTGIRAASIHEMHNNQTLHLPLKNLAAICKVLDCEIDDLITLKKEPSE